MLPDSAQQETFNVYVNDNIDRLEETLSGLCNCFVFQFFLLQWWTFSKFKRNSMSWFWKTILQKKTKKKNYCWKIRSEIVNSKFLQEVVHLTKSIISSFSLEILIPQILLKLHPKTRDPEDLLQHQITNLLINITHENAMDQEVSHSKTRLSIGKSKS